jgi:hypothetical protein
MASMRGRPIKSGDLGFDQGEPETFPASMKGRPIENGDLM